MINGYTQAKAAFFQRIHFNTHFMCYMYIDLLLCNWKNNVDLFV